MTCYCVKRRNADHIQQLQDGCTQEREREEVEDTFSFSENISRSSMESSARIMFEITEKEFNIERNAVYYTYRSFAFSRCNSLINVH